MLEDDFVRFAADARALVTAKRAARRDLVVAVYPHAARLHRASGADGASDVLREDAAALRDRKSVV